MKSITFTDEMLRSILEGTKTQTRRPVKMPMCEIGGIVEPKSLIQADCITNGVLHDPTKPTKFPVGMNGAPMPWDWIECPYGNPGDRLQVKGGPVLEIISVRVERLQEITESDAECEGVEAWYWGQVDDNARHMAWKTPMVRVAKERHRGSIAADAQFVGLWDSIYHKKPDLKWDANPFVWVIEFKVVTP